MCTVTWLRNKPGSYSVFFNRDEQRTRAPAHPPREQNRGGIRFLAPIDGEAGGTWLAANEHGITVCLLNHYEAETQWRAHHPLSRGLLVMTLVEEPSIAEITRRLEHARPDTYHPFILVAFDAHTTRAHRWDGHHLTVRDLSEDDMPLTTSAFNTAHVLERRRAKFRLMRETAHGLSPAELDAFHSSRDTHDGASSICMTREDAQTVSFSRVDVSPTQIDFYYEPRDNCHPSGPHALAHLQRAG